MESEKPCGACCDPLVVGIAPTCGECHDSFHFACLSPTPDVIDPDAACLVLSHIKAWGVKLLCRRCDTDGPFLPAPSRNVRESEAVMPNPPSASAMSDTTKPTPMKPGPTKPTPTKSVSPKLTSTRSGSNEPDPVNFGTANSSPANSGPAKPGHAIPGHVNLGPAKLGPAKPGPAKLGLAKRDPAKLGPANSGPANSGPANSGPAKVGPAKPGLANTDPAKLGPAKPGPAKPDPAKPDPANPDPGKLGPAKPDPAKPGLANLDPAKLGPDKPGLAKPDTANTGPAKPGPNNPGPAKLGPADEPQTGLCSRPQPALLGALNGPTYADVAALAGKIAQLVAEVEQLKRPRPVPMPDRPQASPAVSTLYIRGLAETPGTSDAGVVRDLLTCLGVDCIDHSSWRRVGPEGGPSRPLLLRVPNAEWARAALSSTSALHGHDTFHAVFISWARSPAQRKSDYEMRRKMRQLNQNNDGNVYYIAKISLNLSRGRRIPQEDGSVRFQRDRDWTPDMATPASPERPKNGQNP